MSSRDMLSRSDPGAGTLWIAVQNAASGQFLCRHARVANTFFSRMKGLLGVRKPDADGGLLIHPSSAVHTWGMTCALDVIALDKGGRVVGLRENVQPRSVVLFYWRTREVLELPAGRIEEASVRMGHTLLVTATGPPDPVSQTPLHGTNFAGAGRPAGHALTSGL